MSRAHRRTRPDLLLVAHGTRDPAGPRALERLRVAVVARLPCVRVRLAYVELVRPLLADTVPELRRPTVVLPALLSTGYHVKHDLPTALHKATAPVVLGAPLGPEPRLVSALADRLRAAGADDGDPVVLAAAGSSDPEARRAAQRTRAMLQEHRQAPVGLAYASMGEPVPEAVRRMRRANGGRVTVAPYRPGGGPRRRAGGCAGRAGAGRAPRAGGPGP